MAQLPGFDDPIDVNSWNSNTQNAQNANNPKGYYHIFGHYPLKTIPPISQLFWSPYRELYKANLGAQIPSLLPVPFPVPPTILFSFPPTLLLFYLATLINTAPTTTPTAVPTIALIAVPNGVFAEVLIATSPPPTTFTTTLVALATPTHRPAITSTSNNSRSNIKGREKRGGTTSGSTRGRGSHEETPMSQSHDIGIFSPQGLPLPLSDWPTLASPSDVEFFEEEKSKKKTWNRNMKPYKKLVLLQKCVMS